MTVKNLKLEDSLEQFVNGEILEGDNAYFCEKCKERVSMVYQCKVRFVSGKVPYTTAAYSSFFRMKQLGAILLPPGWTAISS